MMLTQFVRALFSSGPILIEFDRRTIHVRDIASRKSESYPACVDIGGSEGNRKIIADGESRGNATATDRVWPFDHPRMVLHDFVVAEKLVQESIRRMHTNRFIRPSPIVILHSLVDWDGGLTEIEKRALLELAYSAGAREAYVWQGRRLTDSAIQSGRYKE
ncbi:rod shape-determining protein [Permianibacter aggregans]|uniref:Rod shape-determining protein MreB n=1 Tax=Permianibacter aggregans TaxID=1510150 RepID=A0A4R6V354_9GAMM|nr:rod shape-determining protein [Permianibacter aggregans]QGX38761.1 hypothetical protein E2H98_03435 [Permianibacter aggregans]TDQ50564.1 rod shape-determining protein MreB [Permianibacter aggregans]